MRFVPLGVLLFAVVLAGPGCRDGSHTHSRVGGSEQVESDSHKPSNPWVKYSFAERQGRRLYERYCAVCHGVTGEGDGFNAFNLDPRPRSLADSAYVEALSDETLAQTIALGGRGVNKSVLMPAYLNTLTQDQIRYVVAYIRALSSAYLGKDGAGEE